MRQVSYHSFMKTIFNIIVLLGLLLTASCSTTRPEGTTEAEVLYKEAQKLIADGRYLLATEKLNTIRSQYPYSFYSTHAELLNADILFQQENYVESASAYIVFKDFHPKHEKLDYVIWRIAESFYLQLPETFDRDLAPGYEAIKYYQELLRIFQNSEYAKEATERQATIQEMLNKKEKYIADFYYKTEEFASALYRYKQILGSISDKEYQIHAATRAMSSASFLKRYDDCRNLFNRYKNFVTEPKQAEAFKENLKNCKEDE
ncbi:MAG: hypothetical protein COW00_05400 [Bdellovibrio sp. CG12_big_fil_rev_8_21_14_0_65_39_13]|nr:MAG: hypothetical protein COW78_17935 [Bdellovibrio sp. CG22_combo_CG10-13_8_21_14_all_39_27]PIQ60668.1 MAG: hypothetical protein COW00_05400 [Bdellovibrio sp. CG12_big_fil_rev_8_21_14_0_65_39_13]PIR37052.1 MAG: hypothetical protein COV37_00760 [Bdellovibrio sp. CG11_big_fil_rev_8_21_14_0_20_39_38]PJB52423.1 MAG: hypothetical protein CO099_12605 [Bdellovibrio sp. CG_4_9_14_3_um_filter_39_7]